MYSYLNINMFILKINMIKEYVVNDLFDILALTKILNSTLKLIWSLTKFNVLFILFFLIDRIFYKLIVISYYLNFCMS